MTRYLKIFQNSAPTFRCRPDLVHGMPVARETRRFAWVTPNWRFQLHPPLFMSAIPSLRNLGGRLDATQPSQPARCLQSGLTDREPRRSHERIWREYQGQPLRSVSHGEENQSAQVRAGARTANWRTHGTEK
jgi:hypothetical protein